jgi:ABC-type Fe3+-siderophore transport system permease subunit
MELGITLVQAIAFIGTFLGVLFRTILPYLQKLKEDPDLTFDRKYLVTLAISFVESAVTTMLLFLSLPSEILSTATSGFFVLLATFAWAYTSNDIVNRMAGGTQKTVTNSTAKPPP